ncbi:hypothetical protein [Cyanobium sp. ATX-6F1]|uniref:Orn/Lys/Arg family decarboxylase n=1 Tax=Cyanobium sp. ATX-6F1 TaxID=3137388 RepID=UPI0039BE7784
MNPTYQGLAADLPPLVELVHRRGLPLLVDEAHGAHFGLDPLLPQGALASGADLVVQSLQKAAGGLAQSAVLLLGPGASARVDPAAVERALLWLQTSSPSALLLASCEAALAHLHGPDGRRRLGRSLELGLRLRAALERQGLPVVANDDPLRLVLHAAALGIQGLDADQWLLERGVIAELPEPGCLTFCLGLRPQPADPPVGEAAQAVGARTRGHPLPAFSAPPLPLVAEPELAPAVAWRARAEPVPLAQAAGRLAAEPLCPYPPGIPLLIPGERIDAERADWLRRQRALWPGQIADTVSVLAD